VGAHAFLTLGLPGALQVVISFGVKLRRVL
jgi:hypothetical protein